jgi:hypothetical protein
VALVSGGNNDTFTEPVNVPPAGTIVGGASAGVPGRLLIHAAMTVTALLSIRFRANVGILIS